MGFKKVIGGLKKIAPIAAKVATSGVLGPAVAGTILDALDLGKDATEDDVEAAIAKASPEQLVRLREIEAETERHANDLGFKTKELVYKDRDSARKREAAVQDKTPSILAYIMVGGALGLTTWIVAKGQPLDAQTALLVGSLIGYAWASVQTIISYYFGDAHGSKNQVQDLQDALKGGKS